jgi:hypothetical protein
MKGRNKFLNKLLFNVYICLCWWTYLLQCHHRSLPERHSPRVRATDRLVRTGVRQALLQNHVVCNKFKLFLYYLFPLFMICDCLLGAHLSCRHWIIAMRASIRHESATIRSTRQSPPDRRHGRRLANTCAHATISCVNTQRVAFRWRPGAALQQERPPTQE